MESDSGVLHPLFSLARPLSILRSTAAAGIARNKTVSIEVSKISGIQTQDEPH